MRIICDLLRNGKVVIKTKYPDEYWRKSATIILPNGAVLAVGMREIQDGIQADRYEPGDEIVLELRIPGEVLVIDTSDQAPEQRAPVVVAPQPEKDRLLVVGEGGVVRNTLTGARARVVDFQKLGQASGSEFERAIAQLANGLRAPYDEAERAVLALVDPADREYIQRYRQGSVRNVGDTIDVGELIVPEIVLADGSVMREADARERGLIDGIPTVLALQTVKTTLLPTYPLIVSDRVSMSYRSGASDKVYHVLRVNAPSAQPDTFGAVGQTGDQLRRYRLVVAWGRRGARLTWMDKLSVTVSRAALVQAMDVAVEQKQRDGYRDDDGLALPEGFVSVDEQRKTRAKIDELRARIGAKVVVDGKLTDEPPAEISVGRQDMRRSRTW